MKFIKELIHRINQQLKDYLIEAFIKLGRKDPVEYVDGWDVAKNHVTKLLANHNA